MPLSAIVLVIFLVTFRLYLIRPSPKQKQNRNVASASTCSVAVFLGSGGHTSEALALVSSLDSQRYNRRTYIVTSGDTLSAQKALEFETKLPGPPTSKCSIISIPRARHVHQPLITTPFSSLLSLLTCIYYFVFRPLIYFRPQSLPTC
ncbi:oligosaccharide biosynthesis protein Alg14 like-domain-containing protein [Gymnopilus junonius]|uniref:UDP-N-acetylglucosamine transferase subunit ALG14 n=1 Tax=Gymnopilus junonius TaxID=109634 RepID=A0A9P5NW12_GYMJU|nr:oligosaccharide biosynthesis protein Alg14 like-domain-containing protein [Gymnopilus junonius]